MKHILSIRQKYCFGKGRKELAQNIKQIRSWHRTMNFFQFVKWAIQLERRIAKIEFHDYINSRTD